MKLFLVNITTFAFGLNCCAKFTTRHYSYIPSSKFWFVLFVKAENEVAELTKQLEELEDELDAAESSLAEINSKLYVAETTADESER